jgi:hypothetical protein
LNFICKGLDHSQFEHLYGLSNAELKSKGVIAYIADSQPGFPCRVTLQDVQPNERLLLLNYTHLDVDSPYRASHAVFVKDGGKTKNCAINEVPEIITNCTVSIRGYDNQHMMVEAEAVEGSQSKQCIQKILANNEVCYIQIHTTKRGCFLTNVERA